MELKEKSCRNNQHGHKQIFKFCRPDVFLSGFQDEQINSPVSSDHSVDLHDGHASPTHLDEHRSRGIHKYSDESQDEQIEITGETVNVASDGVGAVRAHDYGTERDEFMENIPEYSTSNIYDFNRIIRGHAINFFKKHRIYVGPTR